MFLYFFEAKAFVRITRKTSAKIVACMLILPQREDGLTFSALLKESETIFEMHNTNQVVVIYGFWLNVASCILMNTC